MKRWIVLLGIARVAGAAEVSPVACENRLVRNSADCCWPGQRWSKYLELCVGEPACPSGYLAKGDACWLDCGLGRIADEETGGHCCWRGQVWSHERRACVGVPVECPVGYGMRGEKCAPGCLNGQVADGETAGHCCWPRQAWSERRGVCVGIPRCPSDYEVQGERCVMAPPPIVVEEQPRRVRARFEAVNPEDVYEVRVNRQVCETPCELTIEAGGHRVEVGGPAQFTQEVDLEPGRARLLIHHVRPGRHVGGAASLAVALASFVSAFAVAFQPRTDLSLSFLLGLAGGGFVSLGVPFISGGGSTGIDVKQGRWLTKGMQVSHAARGAIFSF